MNSAPWISVSVFRTSKGSCMKQLGRVYLSLKGLKDDTNRKTRFPS